MNYKEYSPGKLLKEHVQCYFLCEAETDALTDDKIFASGAVEIMFNIGASRKKTIINDVLVNEPLIQLWGQTIQPLAVKSFGKHTMFGIRFFAHTASCFLNESIEQFNDKFFDLRDVAGNEVSSLHLKLLEARYINRQIELTEEFLLQRLSLFEKRTSKVHLMNSIMKELKQDNFFDNIDNVAIRHGISSRYLQKIFLQYSGLTPNLFSKIDRFQKSLHLVAKKDMSLTSIAYQCGYFDQSHFIKDFKSFTGSTPSHFQPETSTELLVSLNN